MKTNRKSSRPYVGRHCFFGSGEWSWTLKGDWSKPPGKVPSNIKRLCIDNSHGFVGRNTDFLARFPRLHSVEMSFDWRPVDFSGLYHLTQLRELSINPDWIAPNSLPPLDLSRIPTLRRFTSLFFANIRGLETLKHLTELKLHHVYGTKKLDFSHHPRLKTLDIGPANGVQEVCLEGLTSLRSLSLACMRNLTSITGTAFYDTITRLDICASHRIPASILARFRRLKTVEIGTKSSLTPASFPLCSPIVVPGPV